MKIAVVCFGAMRAYLPEGTKGNRAEIEVADGASVGDIVDGLGAPRRLVFSLLIDGARTELSSTPAEGSEVTLMPPFAGGAARPV